MKLISSHLLCAILLTLASLASAQQDMVPPAGGAADPALNSSTGALPQRAAIVRYTLLMPNDKTSERVKAGERNPYGKSDEEARKISFKGSNEENVIRDQLLKLRVVGASFDANRSRIMLGDMPLTVGDIVPPVMVDQSLTLKVAEITPTSIVLAWVEKKPSGLPARTLVIPVDLRPSVKYAMHGQPRQTEKEVSSASGKNAILAHQFKADLNDLPPANDLPEPARTTDSKKMVDSPQVPVLPDLPAEATKPNTASATPAGAAPAEGQTATDDAFKQAAEPLKQALGFLSNIGAPSTSSGEKK